MLFKLLKLLWSPFLFIFQISFFKLLWFANLLIDIWLFSCVWLSIFGVFLLNLFSSSSSNSLYILDYHFNYAAIMTFTLVPGIIEHSLVLIIVVSLISTLFFFWFPGIFVWGSCDIMEKWPWRGIAFR